MSTFLKEVDIKSLIAMETTIDGKTQMLESIINFGLDSLIPLPRKQSTLTNHLGCLNL